MDKSFRQTFSSFDFLHSSHEWLSTMLSCRILMHAERRSRNKEDRVERDAKKRKQQQNQWVLSPEASPKMDVEHSAFGLTWSAAYAFRMSQEKNPGRSQPLRPMANAKLNINSSEVTSASRRKAPTIWWFRDGPFWNWSRESDPPCLVSAWRPLVARQPCGSRDFSFMFWQLLPAPAIGGQAVTGLHHWLRKNRK